MVDPHTNSLLLLYDDAQSIYERTRSRAFSFKSVGVQARGRTTILSINYRNSRQILGIAADFARDLLSAEESDEDGVPLIHPRSSGRDGPVPQIIRLPSQEREATEIVERLKLAHRTGTAWQEIAIIYRNWYPLGGACQTALRRPGIPVVTQKEAGFSSSDAVKLVTMHSSKGLEFPYVIIPGIGQMPRSGENVSDEARLLYIAMTRATHHLLLTVSGDSEFARRF